MNCRPILLCFLLLSSLCVFVYYPSLSSGFVNLDDPVMVTTNSDIMNLSWPAARQWFTSFHYNMYHPLVSLSYAIEYHFFQADPFVYHATNLFLHILNSMLVLAVFLLLTERMGVSLLVAALFAAHPMHVESVAWITERKDVLYAFFFLWGAAAYCWYARRSARYGYALALIFFVLSLLSKSMAVSFPAVLMLIDYHLGRRFDRQALIRYAPFWALSAGFAIATFAGQYSPSARTTLTLYNVLVNSMTAAHNVFFYLEKLAAPAGLICIYPPVVPKGTTPSLAVQYAPLALLLLGLGVIYFGRKNRKILFGAGLFIVTVLPVIGIIPVGLSPVADRYTYIPYIGLFYCSAVLLHAVYQRLSRPVLRRGVVALGALYCCVLAVMAQEQCRMWQSNMRLNAAIIELYPRIPFPYNGRSLAYKEQGDMDRAFADALTCLRLDPSYTPGYINRGLIYMGRKDYEAAEADLRKACSLSPGMAEPYSHLGMLFLTENKFADAQAFFEKALRRNPRLIHALTGKTSVLILQRNNDEALRTAQRMRSIAPYSTGVLKILADVYSRMDNDAAAAAVYQEAIRIDPADPDLYNLLGAAYGKMGQTASSLASFSTAIRLQPNLSSAWHNRGNIWGKLNRLDRALADYTVAVTIEKSFGEAFFKRAVVYAARKKYSEARREAALALAAGYTVDPSFTASLPDKRNSH